MDERQIQNLLDKYHVPRHIRIHSEKVDKIALYMAKRLIEKREDVNFKILHPACMLHDLMKICDMRNFNPANFPYPPNIEDINVWNYLRDKYENQDHAELAARILVNLNEYEVAKTIKKHNFLNIIAESPNNLQNWEEKLLYYADKRVMHGDVVSIKERIRDGEERYPRTDQSMEQIAKYEKAKQALYDLEKEIFGIIKLPVQVINEI